MKKVFLFFLALLMLYPIGNFFAVKKTYLSDEAETQQGISYIQNLEAVDVQKAEEAVLIAEEIRNYVPETMEERVKNRLKELDKGEISYRKAFKKVYFVGDSLMNGLESYNILNPNRLITQVSASLYHLADNFDNIVELNPPVLILHYGVNMIGSKQEHLDNFISMYSGLVKKLSKKLPDTRIIVSALFPVDRSIATADRFGNIHDYNVALKKMCKELNVDFLSNAALFKEIEYCYGSDGIHLSKAFYKQWLRYIIEKMEIV